MIIYVCTVMMTISIYIYIYVDVHIMQSFRWTKVSSVRPHEHSSSIVLATAGPRLQICRRRTENGLDTCCQAEPCCIKCFCSLPQATTHTVTRCHKNFLTTNKIFDYKSGGLLHCQKKEETERSPHLVSLTANTRIQTVSTTETNTIAHMSTSHI